ncbi:hypothetical protein BofuT4_P149570.1 [Botrytis cinerea T4]|uniref:Uncharacterized protein n=1 Tax=Botryotinia fuckeliana (strain T4) TaxID=999810 RepID=G2YXA9_BOTF4|nr:hypothetical protein BofuT4_P149570.1 [Botrytis cinerea T4]
MCSVPEPSVNQIIELFFSFSFLRSIPIVLQVILQNAKEITERRCAKKLVWNK